MNFLNSTVHMPHVSLCGGIYSGSSYTGGFWHSRFIWESDRVCLVWGDLKRAANIFDKKICLWCVYPIWYIFAFWFRGSLDYWVQSVHFFSHAHIMMNILGIGNENGNMCPIHQENRWISEKFWVYWEKRRLYVQSRRKRTGEKEIPARGKELGRKPPGRWENTGWKEHGWKIIE